MLEEQQMMKLLVVDDDEEMCDLIAQALRAAGMSVWTATTGARAFELLDEIAVDVLVTDLNLRSMSGLDVCGQALQRHPDLPVIVVTAFGDMQAAIEAIRAGAYDFINKPMEMEALVHAVRRAGQHYQLSAEVKRLRGASQTLKNTGQLVGESAPMRRVYDLIARVANSDASVLLTGESGTGKELVARALHSESERAGKAFIPINCAAVPAQLLESELFGHVRGAFTDARQDRKGLFEQSAGGTVLLDEVGEIPLEMQAKLLRVLQEHAVRPVGGSREIPFDARIIAATNRDLEAEAEEGKFREDLYYRLNVVQIHVPPLRARGNDVLLLAQYFLERSAKRSGKGVTGISSDAAKKLLEYDWPGNVRQLENWMERAVTLTRFDQITVDDLPEKVREGRAARADSGEVDPEHLLTLAEHEQRYVERVLDATGGNKTQAAKVLGLDRRTLYRKLERYGAPTE